MRCGRTQRRAYFFSSALVVALLVFTLFAALLARLAMNETVRERRALNEARVEQALQSARQWCAVNAARLETDELELPAEALGAGDHPMRIVIRRIVEAGGALIECEVTAGVERNRVRRSARWPQPGT